MQAWRVQGIQGQLALLAPQMPNYLPKVMYEIVICNKCNFHRQNIQISKPDGGGILAAKSLTGRHKNDTTPLCTRTMLVNCTTQSSLSRLEVGACKTVFCSLNWTPGGKKCRIFIWPSTVAEGADAWNANCTLPLKKSSLGFQNINN